MFLLTSGPEWDSSDEEIVEPKATQKIAKKKSIDKKPTSQNEGEVIGRQYGVWENYIKQENAKIKKKLEWK